MVKHTQTIYRQKQVNFLSVFGYFYNLDPDPKNLDPEKPGKTIG